MVYTPNAWIIPAQNNVCTHSHKPTRTSKHVQYMYSAGMVMKLNECSLTLTVDRTMLGVTVKKNIIALIDGLVSALPHTTVAFPSSSKPFSIFIRPIFLIFLHFTDTLLTWTGQTLIPSGIQQNRKSTLISTVEFERTMTRDRVLASSSRQSYSSHSCSH